MLLLTDMSLVLLLHPCVTVSTSCQGDGGCKKTIVKKGEGWEMPEAGDEVTGALPAV